MKQLTKEEKVASFHEAMGLSVNNEARTSLLQLRARLIKEEASEVDEAIYDMLLSLNFGKEISGAQWEHLLKELCDLQYVLSGTIVSLRKLNSIPFDIPFNLVHESNMSKLNDNGEPVKNTEGKVLKGPNYKEPNLKGCIQ
jgi:Glu-tRNA(Gln) amidotransferase subunit E-like FAD-binding protein